MKVRMKSALAVAAVIGFAALPALAQQGNGGGGQGQQMMQQRFEQRKADILQHLKDAEACVQAATDRESLRACRPRGGPGGGGPGGSGDMGGEGGGSAGGPPGGPPVGGSDGGQGGNDGGGSDN